MINYLFQVIGLCMRDTTQVKIHSDVDFLLEENDWNDFGYVTSYYVHATPKISKQKESYCLGGIRIMKLGQKEHEVNLLRND